MKMEALVQSKICVRKELPIVLLLGMENGHYITFFSQFSNKSLLAACVFIVLRLNIPLFFQPQCYKLLHVQPYTFLSGL